MVASPVGSFAIVDDATEKVTLSYSGLVTLQLVILQTAILEKVILE